MNRLEQRVARDLRQIADRAAPSPTAWDTIRARIEGQAPADEPRLIMLTDDTPHTQRRWRTIAIAAAAAVIALVVGIVLVTRDDDPEVSADAPSPEEVLADYANAHDLDAVMALYAEDAVVTGHPLDADGVAEGLDEIRVLEQDGGEGAENSSYEVTDLETTGNTMTFIHIYRDGPDCFSGRDRVVVEQGKILRWEWLTPGNTLPCPNS